MFFSKEKNIFNSYPARICKDFMHLETNTGKNVHNSISNVQLKTEIKEACLLMEVTVQHYFSITVHFEN